ncbi:hypothetical protein [Hornefia butyriciproducens]|uniref:hypothetical protein n=1 Tax=Hornefia butyriciproducens TaxID=2652293 RepID=UPI003F8AC195
MSKRAEAAVPLTDTAGTPWKTQRPCLFHKEEMFYILILLACSVAAMVIFFVTLVRNFNKHVLLMAAAVTMLINMFAMHYVTWLGLCLTVSLPLSVVYVLGVTFPGFAAGRENIRDNMK